MKTVNVPVDVKRCNSCEQIIPISEFHKHGERLHGTCRVCLAISRRGTQRYVPRSKPKRRIKKVQKAQHMIEHLVERKHIKKPNRCSACKEKVSPQRLHGHHHNGYKNQQDIKWLCHSCHAAEHAGYLRRIIGKELS